MICNMVAGGGGRVRLSRPIDHSELSCFGLIVSTTS